MSTPPTRDMLERRLRLHDSQITKVLNMQADIARHDPENLADAMQRLCNWIAEDRKQMVEQLFGGD